MSEVAAGTACWRCHQPTGDALFCPACQALQAPPQDYYRAFGIPTRLVLDEADLQQRFYALSRQIHPDRFTLKDPLERQHSLDATAVLNDGYRVLRDPVARAEYVLKRHGLELGEQRSKDVPPELLEEVFELNMALEEVRGGEAGARGELEGARQRFVALQAAIDADLHQQFRAYDDSQSSDVLATVRGLLNRRRYIRNLVRDVEAALAA